MAYPRKPKGDDPNEAVISDTVVPPVPQVTAPSATGGAPRISDNPPEPSSPRTYRSVWMDQNHEDRGTWTTVPAPPKSIADFQSENQEPVNRYAERLRATLKEKEANGEELDTFWNAVQLNPEAVAASVLRRTQFMNEYMAMPEEQRRSYYSQQVVAWLANHPVYKYMRWLNALKIG